MVEQEEREEGGKGEQLRILFNFVIDLVVNCVVALTSLSNCSMALLTLVHPTISKFLINLLTTQPQWTVMVLATVSALSLLSVCSPTMRRWCSQASPWSKQLQLGSCRGVEDTPDRCDWRRESSCWTRDGYWSRMGSSRPEDTLER